MNQGDMIRVGHHDVVNYRVITCGADDVAQEIIADDDGDIVDQRYVTEEDHEEVQTQLVQVSELEHASVGTRADGTQYLHIVEHDSVPLVFFSDEPHPSSEPGKIKHNRKKGDFTVPHEMLDSPKFKLYLYNCKQCDFKCNAIKELTAHRFKEHAANGQSNRYRNVTRTTMMPPPVSAVPEATDLAGADIVFGVNMSYCSLCNYSSISPGQVKRHIMKSHRTGKTSKHQAIDENREIKESKSSKYVMQQSQHSFYKCEVCRFESNSLTKYQKHNCFPKNTS